jgi:hypothetical protein
MKDTPEGEVQITLLAAGMDPGSTNTNRSRQDSEVFGQPPTKSVSNVGQSQQPAPKPSVGAPIELDEIDLDIPTFLRRQKNT